jgi:hypothetical protein|tara:strand:- start:1784 stop:2167 length:384 start_codon:yes stop_codon:yes gene_type:complete
MIKMTRFFKKITEYISYLYLLVADRKNAIYVKMAMSIGNEIAKNTKTDMDDKVMAYLATYISKETRSLDEDGVKKLSSVINSKTKGTLKDVLVSIDSRNGIKLGIPFGSVRYNPKDGSVSFGKSTGI